MMEARKLPVAPVRTKELETKGYLENTHGMVIRKLGTRSEKKRK
jgi:hypothetical protein